MLCRAFTIFEIVMASSASLIDAHQVDQPWDADGNASSCSSPNLMFLQFAAAKKTALCGDNAVSSAAIKHQQPDVVPAGYEYLGQGACRTDELGYRGRDKAPDVHVCAKFCNEEPRVCKFMSFKPGKVCRWYGVGAGNCSDRALPGSSIYSYRKLPTSAPTPFPTSADRSTVASWTQEEALAVMEKIHTLVYYVRARRPEFYKQLECYAEHPNSTAVDFKFVPCSYYCTEPVNGQGCDSDVKLDRADKEWYYASAGIEPQTTFAMLLRFGFHGCMRNKGGTGGCNGCMNLERAFLRLKTWPTRTPPRLSRPVNPTGHNANLALLADLLEKVYTDPEYPPLSRKLPRSLKDSGKSRADLWAFVASVAVWRGMTNSNDACDMGTNIYSDDVMPSGFPCKISPERNLSFYSGRIDCDDTPSPWSCDDTCTGPDWSKTCTENRAACGGCAECPRVESYGGMLHRPRAYENLKAEVPPNNNWNGSQVADYFAREFGFSMQQTVAIMGAHGVGMFHGPVTGGLHYQWTHKQASELNNLYYRIILALPGKHYERGQIKSSAGIAAVRAPAIAVGSVGNALSRSGLRLHKFGSELGGGPVQWSHVYERCPTCQDGINIDRHAKLWHQGVAGVNGANRCCELCDKATSASGYEDREGFHYSLIGLNQSEELEFTRFGCLRNLSVHETLLSADVGLAQALSINEGGVPYGCSGLQQPKAWASCPPNDYTDGESEVSMAQIVERYASDQNTWATDFVGAFEKMLSNGAPPVSLTKAFDFGGVVCARGVVAAWEAKTLYAEGSESSLSRLWKCTKS